LSSRIFQQKRPWLASSLAGRFVTQKVFFGFSSDFRAAVSRLWYDGYVDKSPGKSYERSTRNGPEK
jgi:hypothetical protein